MIDWTTTRKDFTIKKILWHQVDCFFGPKLSTEIHFDSYELQLRLFSRFRDFLALDSMLNFIIFLVAWRNVICHKFRFISRNNKQGWSLKIVKTPSQETFLSSRLYLSPDPVGTNINSCLIYTPRHNKKQWNFWFYYDGIEFLLNFFVLI